MPRRTLTTVAASLATIACVLSARPAAAREFPDDAFYMKADNPDQKALESLVGKPAPALVVAGWRGKPVTAADMAGKVVVIDVWATWCGPCIASIPHNNEMAEKYAKDGLLIVGVCSSRGQEKMDAVADDKKVVYPMAKDPDGKTAAAYKVGFFPTYVVIGRDGKVRAAGLSPNGVEGVVKKLLAEKGPAA